MSDILTKEARQALEFLVAFPSGNTVLETSDLKSLLLFTGGSCIVRGHVRQFNTESLGVGVHRITLKKEAPDADL